MSSDYTSKIGYPQQWEATGQAIYVLQKSPSWSDMTIVRIERGRDEEAFEWCIERLGHYEVNSSYGVTTDTKWIGPLFAPELLVGNDFVFKDRQDAALFRMFFG